MPTTRTPWTIRTPTLIRIRTPISTTPASTRAPGGTRAEVTPAAALTRSLEPVSSSRFLADYWERRPLVVGRDEPGRFDDLLSASDVEHLVSSAGLRYPAFRLVKEGERFSAGDYTTDVPWRPVPFSGTADVERVAAEWANGATIVLQGLHLHWPPLAAFCRALELELAHPVQANAYYTPKASQGLAVHHDTHDVLVLQVSGEKRWLVYEPVLELPLRDQRYSRELGEPGAVVEDVVLRAGDTLYLPRGWMHEAVTSATDSLHLTIGINVYTWLDAVRAALEECADEVEYRHSVSDDGVPPEGLLDAIAERLSPEAVLRRRRERFVQTRRPILHGQLTQLRLLESLTPQTAVERRPTVVAELTTDDSAVTLSFAGKRIRLPAHANAPLAFAAETPGAFTPEELPGDLDTEGRLVLVRRLVREGFLRISEPQQTSVGGSSPQSDGLSGAHATYR